MPAECHTGVSGPSEEGGLGACSGVLYSERGKGGGRMEGEREERRGRREERKGGGGWREKGGVRREKGGG